MYSFVIKIAVDVRRAAELVITMPILRLNIDIAEEVIADPDPNNISVIIIIIFFFLMNYISSYNIHYHF